MSESTMKYGVALYSYTGDFQVTMTLEDCVADTADMGATGIEILSDTHIPVLSLINSYRPLSRKIVPPLVLASRWSYGDQRGGRRPSDETAGAGNDAAGTASDPGAGEGGGI
jgi:hypothetical protein